MAKHSTQNSALKKLKRHRTNYVVSQNAVTEVRIYKIQDDKLINKLLDYLCMSMQTKKYLSMHEQLNDEITIYLTFFYLLYTELFY